MSSSPHSTNSDDSVESAEMPSLEFHSVSQVEELYEQLIEQYNETQELLETYEGFDDDIQELREKSLDQYEFLAMAEAYDAVKDSETARGCRNQAEECDERIKELQEGLDGIDIESHFYEMYKVEIKKETYEIMLKACEKYLERSKKRKTVESKRQTIRPASPRRYPKAASPSRLANLAPATYSEPAEPVAKLELPKVEVPKTPELELPPPPAPKPALPLLKVDPTKIAALPLPPPSLAGALKKGKKK